MLVENNQKFRKSHKPLSEIKSKIWVPDDQVYGTLNNHIKDMTDETLNNIIYLIHRKRKTVLKDYLNSIK